MLYKVTLTGHRGAEEVYYMNDKVLESLSSESIVKVEKMKQKLPNKYDDGKGVYPHAYGWDYEDRVL
jgi:hypothetical protein